MLEEEEEQEEEEKEKKEGQVDEMWGVEIQRERLDIDKESFKVSLVRMKGNNCEAHDNGTGTKIKKQNQDPIKYHVKDQMKDMSNTK